MTLVEARIDHLVYAVPDLAAAVRRIPGLLGVEAVEGGRHPRWGTHNALIGLDGGRYLELVAPDPDAGPLDKLRPFGLDAAQEARLATWAARAKDLHDRIRRARVEGIDPGPVLDGSRELLEGGILRWRLTDPAAERAGGVVPFFIDWGDSPHPSAGLPCAVRLLELRAEHPEPATVCRTLRAVGAPILVEEGPRPALVAALEGPGGRVKLR